MHMWQEMILFICAFVLSNGIIMLVCWFSHSIMSSSNTSLTLDDFLFMSERRRALNDTTERLSFVDTLGTCKPHRQPEYVSGMGGKDSGGSEAEDTESEEEAHMTHALVTCCPVRMGEEGKCWRIQKKLEAKVEQSKLLFGKSHRESKAPQSNLGPTIDPIADWASQLLYLEEEETQLFKNELQSINWKKTNCATGINIWDTELDDLTKHEILKTPLTEYRRYHALVPVNRFDVDYIMMGQDEAIGDDSLSMPELSQQREMQN